MRHLMNSIVYYFYTPLEEKFIHTTHTCMFILLIVIIIVGKTTDICDRGALYCLYNNNNVDLLESLPFGKRKDMNRSIHVLTQTYKPNNGYIHSLQWHVHRESVMITNDFRLKTYLYLVRKVLFRKNLGI